LKLQEDLTAPGGRYFENSGIFCIQIYSKPEANLIIDMLSDVD